MRRNLLTNKRAIEKEGILIMVIVLILLFVLILLVKTVFAPTINILDEQACRNSVRAQSQHIIRGLDFSNEIKCPTRYVTIKETDEEKIKYAFAEEMRKCWYQFGEGKWNLFSGTDAFCAICSVVNFSTDMPIKGFSRYLMETTMKGSDISYADYLQGYSTKKTDVIENKMTQDQLEALDKESTDTTKKYAVVFTYARGQDIVEEYKKHVFGQTVSGKASIFASAVMGTGAALSTGATLIAISTPVGWVAVGVTATAIAAYTGTEFITTFFRETKPEWLSMVVVREYDKEGLESIYCKTLPVSQEKAKT